MRSPSYYTSTQIKQATKECPIPCRSFEKWKAKRVDWTNQNCRGEKLIEAADMLCLVGRCWNAPRSRSLHVWNVPCHLSTLPPSVSNDRCRLQILLPRTPLLFYQYSRHRGKCDCKSIDCRGTMLCGQMMAICCFIIPLHAFLSCQLCCGAVNLLYRSFLENRKIENA